MDFELSEELVEVKQMMAEFGKKEIYPLVAGWDREDKTIPKEISLELGRMGMLGLTIPEEFGGTNLGHLAEAVAIEELCHSSRASVCDHLLSAPNGSYTSPFLHFGTKEQQDKYLPGVVTGEIQGAMAITEPSGSSSLNNLGTKARLEGDNYIVDGSKVFITRADTADFIITIADSPEGSVALVIDAGTPGMTVAKSEVKMGHHGVGLNPVFYDNVVVPKSQLLGKVGQGTLVAKDSLYDARLAVSAASVGMAQAAIDVAIEYAKSRMINGHSVASFQNTQFVLADAQTKVDAARLLVYRCASAMDAGKHEYYMSSMAKWYASEVCGEVTDKCLQVFGGYGYTKDYDIERMYRDVRVLRILDGATEIHKRLISKWMGVR